MAAMLLDHGADFTIADKNGETPLKLAIENNRQDIVELLQQHGAKK
jgi:ankyrin repeat protein